MPEVVSNLYRVTVAIQSGRSWNVLVRAVDAESAAGAVRARGHHVVSVAVGAMPRPGAGTPRISCVNCGYLLKNLPVGPAGDVLCPECGVVNTPLAGADSMWEEIKATRAELKQQRRERPFVMRSLTLLGAAVVVFGVLMFAAIPLLKWWGLLP